MSKNREKDSVITMHKLKCSMCKGSPLYMFRIGRYIEYACSMHVKDVQGMLELQSTMQSTYEAK